MKKGLRNSIIGLTATVGAIGGVDAAVMNEELMRQDLIVAFEKVEVRQIGNEVSVDMPWKGGNGIRVKHDLGAPTLAERLRDWRGKEVVTEVVDFGEGGFKVDFVLNERPRNNQFCYDIEGGETFEWHYQASSTIPGVTQPENVIGSYAVYRGQEKFMHIPRPEVWEINNPTSTRVWADMNVNQLTSFATSTGTTTETTLCVTVDPDYLANASYPVRVDPTFGYTALGASSFRFLNNDCAAPGVQSARYGGTFTATQSGDIRSVSIPLSGDPNSVTMSGFLNDKDSVATGEHGELGSAETTEIRNETAGFYEFTFSSPATVVGGDEYIISVEGDGADVDCSVDTYADFITAEEWWTEDNSTYDKESPWTRSASADFLFSMFATYVDTAAFFIPSFDGAGEFVEDDGSVNINANPYMLSTGATSDYNEVGTRFTNVPLTQGETIKKAWLYVIVANHTTNNNEELDLYGIDEDNTAVFAATTNNLSTRPLTTATVSTNIEDDTQRRYHPIEVTSIVQEIIDRPGWSSGNAMGFNFVANSIGHADLEMGNDIEETPILYVLPESVLTTGQLDPSNNTAGAGGGFTNPANAYSSNNSYATYDGAGGISHVYYDFDIPDLTGNVIEDIVVTFEGQAPTTNDDHKWAWELSNDGGTTWTTIKFAGAQMLTTDSTVSYGGGSLGYDLGFTPAELTNSNFRVRVSTPDDTDNNQLSLDHLQVEVFYSEPVVVGSEATQTLINTGIFRIEGGKIIID